MFSLAIQNKKKQYILIFIIFLVYVYIHSKLEPYLFHYDDAYITYVFAKNFSLGHGIVYHPEFKPVQGSSTLLYTILLGAISYITKIDVAIIGYYLFAIQLFGASLIFISLYLESQTLKRKFLYLVTLISFPVPTLLGLGMESSWMLFLLIIFLYFVLNNNTIFSGITMGLIFWSRIDFIIYAPLLLFLQERRKIIKAYLILILIISIYLLFSQIYFGSIIPNTWKAKSYFLTTIGRTSFLDFPKINIYVQGYLFFSLMSILFLILSKKLNKKKYFLLLGCLIISIIHLIILEVKNATAMPWYFIILLTLNFWILLVTIYELRIHYKYLSTVFTLVILYNFMFSFDYYKRYFFAKDTDGSILWDKRGHNDRREIAGKYLAQIDPNITHKVVLFFEAGKIPYYSGCKGIDILGLASPEAIPGLMKKDSSITFFASNPDYVVGVNAPHYFPMTFIEKEEFKNNYEVLLNIQDYTIWKKK